MTVFFFFLAAASDLFLLRLGGQMVILNDVGFMTLWLNEMMRKEHKRWVAVVSGQLAGGAQL